jgi:dUTP pyrophosphatase
MDKRIQFTKIRKVKSPNRANSHDAGTDFFIPEYTDSFLKDLMKKNTNNKVIYQPIIDEQGDEVLEMILAPHAQINIPSGIKVNILDKNTYLDANNKSGVATKYRLVVGAKVVDADYQGEIHLNLINTSNEYVSIRTGQKIVQFIHKEFINTAWEEITTDEYNSLEATDRGTGGFASTGEK